MSLASPTRVVVTDDSPLMRRIVASALTEAGFEVVAEAADGDEAIEYCEQLRPDAMMLDLSMPGRDGISVLREMQRRQRDLPVIVVSAFSPAQGARAVDALSEGAFDLVTKPAAGDNLDDFATTLVEKVTAAKQAHATRAPAGSAHSAVHSRHALGTARVVVIATSTGGPRALSELLPRLPSPLGIGTLVVQHMPAGFTTSLAARLDRASALNVREAVDGESLTADSALVAPGGKHLRIARDGKIRITEDPEIGRLRPRADLTIKDAVSAFGARVLLVVMTGMGSDGLIGAREVKRRGGRVIAQDEASSTVYGMPRVVAEEHLTDEVCALGELSEAIAEECGA